MAEPKARESQPSDGPATSEFVGFANAPVNEDGSHVDFRDVPAYDAERDEALRAPSSIVDFKTPGPATNGAPMANVPGDAQDGFLDDLDLEDADSEPDADDLEDEAPDDPATVIEESHHEGPEGDAAPAPSYPELQAQAKELGIPANQSAEALSEAIAAKRAEGEEGSGS